MWDVLEEYRQPEVGRVPWTASGGDDGSDADGVTATPSPA
jgi:hypothetical protein